MMVCRRWRQGLDIRGWVDWFMIYNIVCTQDGGNIFFLGYASGHSYGTVKTVPYIAFYDWPQTLKIFVGQDALTLP